jgi:hypothetical protein
MFDDKNNIPTINDQYLCTQEPRRYESEGSYADPTADLHSVTYEWAHGLGEIVNALIAAGLRIEFLHEFDYVEYQARPFLKRTGEGRWIFPDPPGGVPMMFSIRAVKD